MNRRPKLSIVAPGAAPEEAAAVVAAIEQFMRETAPVVVEETTPTVSPWTRTALQEGVRKAPEVTPFWS